jgi:hypothetical protein
VQAVTLAGEVYLDSNSNAALDAGEQGLANVTLMLTGTNNLGQFITATTVTSPLGTYSFSTDSNHNLIAPGTYQIAETRPASYVQVASNVGTVNGSSDGVSTGPGTIASIILGSGQSGINYNFGLTVPVAVSGYVYLDFNHDDVRDTGDSPFVNQTLFLTGVDNFGNSVSMTTTTDSTGYYLFTGMLAGSYSVSVVAPSSDFKPNFPNVGTVNGILVGVADSFLEIDQISLNSGDVGLEYDFGFVPKVNPT